MGWGCIDDWGSICVNTIYKSNNYTLRFFSNLNISPLVQPQSWEESAQKGLKLNLEVVYYAEHIPTMDLQFCPVAVTFNHLQQPAGGTHNGGESKGPYF